MRKALPVVLALVISCCQSQSYNREEILRQQLATLRTVIHEFKFDRHRPPQSLGELVNEGYLRGVPVDPMTRSSDTWRLVQSDGALVDVHSASDATSSRGTRYSEW